ncbi:MAG TPA: ABC transporter ATP-binding protein [Thermoplasmata archaeon]|nr:ABC transporter ATP-binding protein [Thermoplasmata archaeon]HEV2519197.1 ABC transporter ATP-binding protein [Thermoplasmata archaeon]
MSEGTIPNVTLAGVAKEYAPASRRPVQALEGIDLSIPPGDFLSVEGPSGCGKTTLLNLLGLLDSPTRGEIRWDDRAVGGRTERERTRLRLTGVGFIFQRFYLLPTLTAQENVELPMRALGTALAVRRERAQALLDGVGLAARRESMPHELSGGEEQRVAIARSLANRPGILLADEPTGELDSANAAQVLDVLVAARAATGATLVLVTHNPAVARRAGRHLTMADGHIVADTREG